VIKKLNSILDVLDCASRAHQRMAYTALSFFFVFILSPANSILNSLPLLIFMVVLVVYFLAAFFQSWLLSNRERHWEKIELPSFLLDLPLIGFSLAVAGDYLALFSPLLAVLSLVRGIRHGPCMLITHTIAGCLIVLLLVWLVPFWQGQIKLVYANLLLLLVLPLVFYGETVKIQTNSKYLQQENLTDPLTRSLNRKALEAALTRYLNAKEPFILSFFDLDNFKLVNDTLGHVIGDKLLRRISTKLSNRLRSEDKVYRLSGDEFVVLSLGLSREDVARTLGERIKSAIQEAVSYTCPNLPVSASVGILLVGSFEENRSFEQLLIIADRIMYQAKKSGKNRTEVEKI
jgi:diguanylate cyclase (GGDEF)-like protein